MSEEVTIVLCSKCEGRGKLTWSEVVDYHKREYETYSEDCRFCSGSGRRWKSVTTKYEPYVSGKGYKS